MSIEELRNNIVASPFVPFTLNVADGRRIPVVGRDFILVPPEKGRKVVVYQKNGTYDLLDAMLITGMTFESTPSTA